MGNRWRDLGRADPRGSGAKVGRTGKSAQGTQSECFRYTARQVLRSGLQCSEFRREFRYGRQNASSANDAAPTHQQDCATDRHRPLATVARRLPAAAMPWQRSFSRAHQLALSANTGRSRSALNFPKADALRRMSQLMAGRVYAEKKRSMCCDASGPEGSV